jgi:hypothetical protein
MHLANLGALMRHTRSSLTRRRSLKTLAAAGWVVLAAPPVTTASKKSKRKANQRCRSQISTCQSHFTRFCELVIANTQQCVESTLGCCEHFGQCNAGAALDCIITAID